ncbi:MAG: 3-isopropylmalate dehydratase small subunit [Gammaproteobacteria bacterium]|nr:3-isopropylmalate dehydratase small subunit [Gammaproteobacteria bacterium]
MSSNQASFKTHKGSVIPLDLANVDTDQIIPKQFLKSIKKTGFGDNLFDAWRYEDEGEIGKPVSSRIPRKDFVLNDDRYTNGSILLARRNFACGSSREHAVWALLQYGIRAVIAPSFADIFFNNCFNNGLLPISLSEEEVESLFELATGDKPLQLEVNLVTKTISVPGGQTWTFEVDEKRQYQLIHGLDEIGLTLELADKIKQFEERHLQQNPWL